MIERLQCPKCKRVFLMEPPLKCFCKPGWKSREVDREATLAWLQERDIEDHIEEIEKLFGLRPDCNCAKSQAWDARVAKWNLERKRSKKR